MILLLVDLLLFGSYQHTPNEVQSAHNFSRQFFPAAIRHVRRRKVPLWPRGRRAPGSP